MATCQERIDSLESEKTDLSAELAASKARGELLDDELKTTRSQLADTRVQVACRLLLPSLLPAPKMSYLAGGFACSGSDSYG